MSSKKLAPKKKMNLPALISVLLLPLIFVMLLVPWHRLFILPSDTVSTILIQFGGTFLVGALMIVSAVIGLVRNNRRKGSYFGSWLAIPGLVMGILALIPMVFLVVDYLRFNAG